MGRLLGAAVAALVLNAPAHAGAQGLTCESSELSIDSYRLTTEAQARNMLAPRYRWYDAYSAGKHAGDLADLNMSATGIAERARELDDRNLMAHSQMARQFVIDGIDARVAEEAWRRTLDSGGAVVWTATLHDVDARSYFVVAFAKEAMQIYRFARLAGPTPTTYGIPAFPGPERVAFWRALGGCLPSGVQPDATIPWAAVTELKAMNWVLEFKLDRRITLESDRAKRKHVDRLKVNLHGATGDVEFRYNWDPVKGVTNLRGIGYGPAAYQERVRRTLIKFIDPLGRIKLPRQSRGAGW